MNFRSSTFRFTIFILSIVAVFVSFQAVSSKINFSVNAIGAKPLRQIIYRRFKQVCGTSQIGFSHCFAKVATDDFLTPLAGGSPLATSFGPVQFHTAYNLPCTLGGSASSQCATPSNFTDSPTIAIVDAYNTPTIENDLANYDTYFGIAQCTKANGCLTILNETGGTKLPNGIDPGWSLEASLDVQTAHAICQTCKILLIETNSSSFPDLGTGVNTAANLHATAISNSYGGYEWNGETSYNSYYNHPGVAVTAAAGDSGYITEFPAADPNVVAVGGTTLQLSADNSYSNESAWSSAGSGCSFYEIANSFQTALSNWGSTKCNTKRGIADVSADADPNTGAAVYDSTSYYGESGWFQVGGTSLSSPIIAAVFAMSGGVTGSAIAPDILYQNYSLLNFHDITTGSNGICNSIMCTAGAGYDGPTGLGSPDGMGGFGFITLSPTPTATPTPTLTPTPTATPTPTLTPTFTPTPTLTPISVSITTPANGSLVRHGNSVLIRATATDTVKITKVEFFINGVLLSTGTSSPYMSIWTVPAAKNVQYTISAEAFDVSNNTATANIQVTSF